MAYEEEDLHDMEEVVRGELQLASDDLFFNSLDLARKNKELKLQVEKLINENTHLIDDNKKLKEETHDLHFQILHISNKLKLKEGLIKMGESSKVLEQMLSQQQSPLCKKGLGALGFKGKYNEPLCFTRPSTFPKSPCSYCGKRGHINLFCRMKQDVLKVKCKWVPRSKLTFQHKELCLTSFVDLTQPKGVSCAQVSP